MGLKEIFWDARSDYETTPKKLSDIFIKTINFQRTTIITR